MAKGKAPGIDGLPMEFYLKFWNVLVSLPSPRGVASSSLLSRRKIALIHSINVGYKIASRAIVGRLLKVIHLVVCGGLDLWCTGQVHWRWYFLVKGCSALRFY